MFACLFVRLFVRLIDRFIVCSFDYRCACSRVLFLCVVMCMIVCLFVLCCDWFVCLFLGVRVWLCSSD